MRRFVVLVALVGCKPAGPAITELTPLSASTEAAAIPADGLTLEGELLLPDRFEEQPVTGVVILHGSGPNSRDGAMAGQLNMGFGFEIEVYRELAEGLQEQGFAVLRYDKRTCFSGNGCTNSYPTPTEDDGMPEFLADAAAALDWLGARDDIGNLAVVGHSQGGTLVPILARDYAELDAGVLLAGPYDGIDVLLRYQVDFSEAIMTELGYSQAQIDSRLADLDAMTTDVEALAAGTFSGDTIGGIPTSFWQEWLDMGDDAIDAAQATDVPLAAISGDYDWNVPPSQTEAWHALGLGGAVHSCQTHALNCISEPDWQAIGTEDIGEHVDAVIIGAVAAALNP